MTTTANTTTDYAQLITLIYHHGLSLFTALIIIIAGLFIAKLVRKLSDRIMIRRAVEPTIRLFIDQLLYTLILIIVFIAALAKVGISIASLVAILGAAALAISLSLKDSLSNLASGILLLLFRPFRVADELTFSGHAGIVKSINLLFTTIEDEDQQQTIIPNSKLTSNLMQNIPHQPIRDLHCLINVKRDEASTVEPQLLAIFSQIDSINNRDALQLKIAKLTADSITFRIIARVVYNKQSEVRQKLLQQFYQQFKTQSIDITIS